MTPQRLDYEVRDNGQLLLATWIEIEPARRFGWTWEVKTREVIPQGRSVADTCPQLFWASYPGIPDRMAGWALTQAKAVRLGRKDRDNHWRANALRPEHVIQRSDLPLPV